jgi:hypothetical protein
MQIAGAAGAGREEAGPRCGQSARREWGTPRRTRSHFPNPGPRAAAPGGMQSSSNQGPSLRSSCSIGRKGESMRRRCGRRWEAPGKWLLLSCAPVFSVPHTHRCMAQVRSPPHYLNPPRCPSPLRGSDEKVGLPTFLQTVWVVQPGLQAGQHGHQRAEVEVEEHLLLGLREQQAQ